MHTPRFSVALMLATLALGACTTKEQNATTDSAAATQAGASPGSFDAAMHTATFIAKDFAFVGPDTISGGWTTVRLRNQGTVVHHLAFVRLDSGKTEADLGAAMNSSGPPPAWAVGVGGPNAPDPGQESNAVVKLEPGHYMVLCFVDVPGHVPHTTKGMVRGLVVTAPTGPAAPEPTADITIRMSDYAFTVEGSLTAGRHTFKVVNAGPQQHEVEVVRFAPGKTMKDLAAWVQTMDGPPPGSALGGVVGLVKGAPANYFDLELTPGHYALLCFIPDAKDGKPHLAHGMLKEFTIQ